MPPLALIPLVSGAALGFGYGNVSGVVSNHFFAEYFGSPSAMILEVFSAAMQAGCVFGSMLGGPIADGLGRRICSLTAAIVMFSGCAVLVCPLLLTVSFSVVVVGRCLIGFGGGMACCAVPVYISEAALPEKRGALEACFQLAIEIGILLAYVVNALLLPRVPHGWQWSLALQSVPCLLFVLLFFVLPESPRWLFLKQRHPDAVRSSLGALRGSGASVEAELQEILSSGGIGCEGGWREVFGSHRSFIAMMVLMLQVGTGIDMVTVYAPKIFAEIVGDSEAAGLNCTIFVGVVFVSMTPVAVYTVDRFGRRPLLLIGSMIMTLSLAVLAMQPFLPLYSHESSILCVAMVLMFVSAFSFSWGPLAWLIPSEMIHSRLRARVICLGTILNWIADFVVVSTFLSLTEAVGRSGAFLVYAAINCLALAFCFFCIPETKGMHLDRDSNESSVPDARTVHCVPAPES